MTEAVIIMIKRRRRGKRGRNEEELEGEEKDTSYDITEDDDRDDGITFCWLPLIVEYRYSTS